MADTLERLKILLSSSTPIVVMETVEEMRAVRLVRAACSSLNLATFEWSIASGLVRCGSDVGELVPETGFSAGGSRATISQAPRRSTTARNPPRRSAIWRRCRSKRHSCSKTFIVTWTTRSWCAGCAMWDRSFPPIAAPSSSPRLRSRFRPELGSLVEFLELPLPDKQRLRQIIDEMTVQGREDAHPETHPGCCRASTPWRTICAA